MKVRFEDSALGKLETSTQGQEKWPAGVVKAFRRRMQFIRAMPDERDLRAAKANHYEKMQGDREGQHSVRLNDQFRLVFRFEEDYADKILVVIEIVDPH
ncbi:type II toxin-antitoxin system RelE/ParE family toxin [Humitalea sp. 24SJ18S-53]|uniref:type II toxin-antitoxin system RelE/ParE family toxin n=1 Tax=Humitalea sp. 24SJ18S-53 TaxID=3422307 RepID=UPI003D677CF9